MISCSAKLLPKQRFSFAQRSLIFKGFIMLLRSTLGCLLILALAHSAQAAPKAYNSSQTNGSGGDFISTATNICPPVRTTPGILQGRTLLSDNGAGTITLEEFDIELSTFIDLGPDVLTITFGPGAFIFIDATQTQAARGHVSNTSGVGAHGPSSTAPLATAEWGIVSGFTVTGRTFCISSPVTICNNGPGPHGSTAPPTINSDTYDLGTWSFDAEGDYQIDTPYIQGTNNGGLSNQRYGIRGTFQGASLPALPLIAFGALALSLAAIGGRALLGRK
jgi:hypothetical protein